MLNRLHAALTDRADGSRWLFVSYLALLVWAPIPLGSNRPWSWALLEIWVLLMSLAWLTGHIRGRRSSGPAFRGAAPMLLCSGAWLGYIWLQLLPLPIGLLAWVSPQSAYWHTVAAAPDVLRMAPITLDWYATLDSACKSTAYVASFMLCLVLLSTRDRVRLATYALILSGIVQALYGAYGSLQASAGPASGTFVNRNHYAAYLVMCLSVGIGVLIASLSGQRSSSIRSYLLGVIRWIISPRMGLRLLLVVMVIALVLTRSRMGNLSFFFSLLVAGTIALVASRHATKSVVILLVSLIAIDLLIVGTYFGTREIVQRIEQTSADTEDRDEVASYALDMWKDYPMLGAGLGSFPVVFPKYSGRGTDASYTHAHNDYIEFGAETGIVGFALLGAMVLMSLAAAILAQFRRSDPVMRGLAFAAIMGIVALMIHSSADFNLQIPANALTFMQLLAFAWISLHFSDREQQGTALPA